ncbi:MAG: response regulator transcription factor [Oscillospiraceae bacterium]|nr:response regulator transcription factor [Oscillospiraceae bacterium]
MGYKVLMVEDEPSYVEEVTGYFGKNGLEGMAASNSGGAMELFHSHNFDLVLLDVMLPGGMDGYSVCEEIRKGGSDVPIIFVTALGELHSRRRGYEKKADDYIAKPYSVQELLLKANALILRDRGLLNARQALRCGEIELLPAESEARAAGKPIKLTPKEFTMLEVFMKRPNRMLGREELLNLVWGYDFYADSRVVDATVARLRQKLGEAGGCIQTVYGAGYKLKKQEGTL